MVGSNIQGLINLKKKKYGWNNSLPKICYMNIKVYKRIFSLPEQRFGKRIFFSFFQLILIKD